LLKQAIDLQGEDELEISSVCEMILSYGISFTYCLLENPGIWDDLECS